MKADKAEAPDTMSIISDFTENSGGPGVVRSRGALAEVFLQQENQPDVGEGENTTRENDNRINECIICTNGILERAMLRPCRHTNLCFLCAEM